MRRNVRSGVLASAILWVLPALALEPALERTLESIRENSHRGLKSILVMDLDDTVVDTHLRKYLAYRKATDELCGNPSVSVRIPKSEACERAYGLALQDIYRAKNGYSQPELMDRLGIRDSVFIRDLFSLRRKYESLAEFFAFDTGMPGASAYIRSAKHAGAEIYFVSSREVEEVAEATFAQLYRLGVLAPDEKSFVILRKSGQSSLEFKRQSAESIRTTALQKGFPVVALFENEPANLSEWISIFPEATPFYIEGNVAVPAPVPATAISISNYR